MSSTTVVVTVMAVLMIVMGVIIARVSTRERGMGVAVAVLGVVLVVAYLTADPGAPKSADATPLPATPGEATP